MNKYDNVAAKFCGVEDGYVKPKWMLAPRPHDNFVFASDSRILIRIDKSLCECDYEKIERQPDFNRVIPEPNCSLTLPVIVLVGMIKDIPPHQEVAVSGEIAKCNECNGRGRVQWHYESESGEEFDEYFDCPVCEGRGKFGTKIIYRDDMNISINGLKFRVGSLIPVLETIQALGYDTANVVYMSKEQNSMFLNVEPGVDVLVMANEIFPLWDSIDLKPTKA